jgi:hypothetical protein
MKHKHCALNNVKRALYFIRFLLPPIDFSKHLAHIAKGRRYLQIVHCYLLIVGQRPVLVAPNAP